MDSDLVRGNRITIEVPQDHYFGIPTLPHNVPIFVTTSDLLKRAFEYLIQSNPIGNFPPLYDGNARLERMIGLAGPKDANIRTIDTLLFPEMTLQTTMEVATNYGRLLIELHEEGSRFFHGTMHNHNSKYGFEQNPTPPDEESHETWERHYGPQLTVIASEDGSFGFWRPTDYKVFVDGKPLPPLVGPNLRPNIRSYGLK